MSYNTLGTGDTQTFIAGQDLSAKQYFFMAMATDGQIDPAGDGAKAIGVLQNKPDAAGKAATVATSGITKVKTAGIIAAGANVASDANGNAVTAASGDVILGTAVQAAASGDIIAVQLNTAQAKL